MLKSVSLIFCAGVIFIIISACTTEKPELCQSYKGTLPAASSIGIETTISFYPDHSYSQKDVYIGEDNGTFFEKGSFDINKKEIMLISDAGETSYYQLEKQQIRRLDTQKRQIRGALADFYILTCHRP